jgi:L-asparaginase
VKIKFFSTGGTIDKVYFDAKDDYSVGEPRIPHILEAINVSFEYECEALLHKDSLDISQADRDMIVKRVVEDPCDHIVVTHGTDTMIQTALELYDKVPAHKTVVLTGAMQPQRFSESDAAFNIGCSVATVQSRIGEVLICMSGRIFSPKSVIKNYETNTFEPSGGNNEEDKRGKKVI